MDVIELITYINFTNMTEKFIDNPLNGEENLEPVISNFYLSDTSVVNSVTQDDSITCHSTKQYGYNIGLSNHSISDAHYINDCDEKLKHSTSSLSSNSDCSISNDLQYSVNLSEFKNVSLDSDSGNSFSNDNEHMDVKLKYNSNNDITNKNQSIIESLKNVPVDDENNEDKIINASYDKKNYKLRGKRKGSDLTVLSTTALILEQRPINLPSKPEEEKEKHEREYKDIVAAVKKKEVKELKIKKKQQIIKLKHEDELHKNLVIWKENILPQWHALKNLKRTRDLWWKGIPTAVRGTVWKLAIGNDLNMTAELFNICRNRAGDLLKALNVISENHFEELNACKEQSIELIKLDVERTFPSLCIFQKGGPFAENLHSLLAAYVCYRPDVGYVQGMSFIAAILLLYVDVEDAFICFANLLNRPCQVAFFRLDENLMNSYFEVYSMFFRENLPKLFKHFQFVSNNLTPDLYLIDWIFTLYGKCLPLDIASRVLDIYYRDGEEFLFRTALGILKYYEDIFYGMDFIHVAQFLTHLPNDIDSYHLFKCIESISMQFNKKSFSAYLNNIQRNMQSNNNLGTNNSLLNLDSSSISSFNSNYSQRESTVSNILENL